MARLSLEDLEDLFNYSDNPSNAYNDFVKLKTNKILSPDT